MRMKINEDGTQILELLKVEMLEDDKFRPIINWDYTDKQNAYFLIGVLEIIKQELIDTINDRSIEDG
jgi:hypothetical protein